MLAVLVTREAIDVMGAALKPDFTGAACDCGSANSKDSSSSSSMHSSSSSGISNHQPHDHYHSHHHHDSGLADSPTLAGSAWELLQWMQAPSASLVTLAQAQLLTPSGALKLPPLPTEPVLGGAFTESGGPTRRKPAGESHPSTGNFSKLGLGTSSSSSSVDLEAGGAIGEASRNEKEDAAKALLEQPLPWAVDLDALQTAYEEEQSRLNGSNGVDGGCSNATGSTKSGG